MAVLIIRRVPVLTFSPSCLTRFHWSFMSLDYMSVSWAFFLLILCLGCLNKIPEWLIKNRNLLDWKSKIKVPMWCTLERAAFLVYSLLTCVQMVEGDRALSKKDTNPSVGGSTFLSTPKSPPLWEHKYSDHRTWSLISLWKYGERSHERYQNLGQQLALV